MQYEQSSRAHPSTHYSHRGGTMTQDNYYYGDPTYAHSTDPAPGYPWRDGSRWMENMSALDQPPQSDGQKGNSPETIDMNKRDPNSLNNNIKFGFSDVIGEPGDAHSDDVIWQNSFKCFNTGQSCCYAVLTYLCAIPLAFCWGCHFACLTFNQIWCITPLLRSANVGLRLGIRLVYVLTHCIYDPLFDAMSLACSRIHITQGTAEVRKNYRTSEIPHVIVDQAGK